MEGTTGGSQIVDSLNDRLEKHSSACLSWALLNLKVSSFFSSPCSAGVMSAALSYPRKTPFHFSPQQISLHPSTHTLLALGSEDLPPSPWTNENQAWHQWLEFVSATSVSSSRSRGNLWVFMSPLTPSSISIPKVSRLSLTPQCSYVAYMIWLLLVCFLSLRWYWNQLQIPLTCSYYQDPFLQEQHPVPLSLPSHPLDISISEILSLAVPVIYCCLTNDSKLGGLKQQFIIISNAGSGIQTWHREARHGSTKSGASA